MLNEMQQGRDFKNIKEGVIWRYLTAFNNAERNTFFSAVPPRPMPAVPSRLWGFLLGQKSYFPGSAPSSS